MKRILYFLLLVLMVASTFGTAEAGTRKKQPKKPATVDMDNGGDRDGDRDKDRPKRGPKIKKSRKALGDETPVASKPGPIPFARPIEMQLKRAASKRFDLRTLPARRPPQKERPEREEPGHTPVELAGGHIEPSPSIPSVPPTANPPAPPPIAVYEGLDREFWGAGSPPDTNGDVGPSFYIQTVNTSIGIYDKSGVQQAAFTFDTLMSQGNFGNQCDTENFGDPVVLYDTFEDRWIITDFAFTLDGGQNVNPPIAFQCFAVSMNGNPLTGGWNFYSIAVTDGLNDYPKFGIWTDGLYMSANVFGYPAGAAFITARAWAFNKQQMYAGSPTVQVVAFNIPGGDFTVIPSNARLQTGTPPPGRPNLFLSSWLFTNALTIYKFHPDWNSISLSTFTGPDTPIAATSWPNAAVGNAQQPGTANLLDVLQIRAMVQNQYTNFGGTESLWVPHTVRRAAGGTAAPRWYQVNVTGGTVAGAIPQAATWDPDAANTNHRFMPSLALDRAGDLAMGYSISNSTTMFPSMAYAGRLAGDPINTFSQTEQMLFTGTASQTTSTRWGDYSSMTLDPDGCTFWYTSEYANPADQTAAKRWKTKFGKFTYPSCTPVGAGGTVTGTVTVTPGGTPISGATITFGARSATTNGSGVYSFLNIPAGTYPSISATKPGFSTASASNIVVTDGGTTTQDFALTVAPASPCLTDTTQADFLTGVLTTVDVTTSPGDVTLQNTAVNQQNTAGTTTGTGFGTPAWTGQTFIPSVTGQLVQAEVQLFCNGCGATPPNLTLSVRNTAAGLPTGADLSSVTIPGSTFASGATTAFMATFGAPATLTSGTQYALILRPVAVPAGTGYFWIRSSPSTYASGSRVLSADSGGTWSTDTTRDYNFKAVIQGPYAPPNGNLVSSTKDSNPAGGLTPIWSNLSWNGSTPANTTLQFQVAGSNNPGGPFNFVGPDGTAGTFFTTSPSSLAVLYNLRYAKYKAYLATTNNAVTPVLNDVTMCANNTDCSSTVATITPTPTVVCTNSTGNSASGPAGMTSYAWGITNGTITSATNIQTITYTAGASGTVTLTLTVNAPNGCIASGSTPVTISPNPTTPSITPTPSQVCANSTGNSADGPAGATTYAWSIVNGTITSATNIQTITYTAGASGTVDLTLVVTNAASCSATNTVNVTINANPATPTITPTPATVCGGSTGNTADGPGGATTYAWSIVNGTITSATNIQTITYTAGATGTVDLTLVVTNAATCSASNTVNVPINASPATPTITPTPAQVCANSTGNSASGPAGATTYAWSIVNGTITSATNIQTITYTAGASGTVDLTLVVTNASTCSATNTVNVTINPIPPQPTITPDGPTTFCQGTTRTLTSSSATGNQWYLNGNPISINPSINVGFPDSGDYTVIVTLNGCVSPASAATTVTINPKPQKPVLTPLGPTTFCAGGSVTLSSSGATGIQWYLDGNPLPNPQNTNRTVSVGGSYTVQLTGVGGCLSDVSDPLVVTVNPLPPTPTVTPGGPTTFCAGGSVTLNSSSASGNQWKLNGSPIGGATSQAYVATASGNYTVTVTDGNGCSSTSAATTVTVTPLPATPTITPSGPTTFCAGGSVTLNSSSASGNQWRLNGNPIGGATNQAYVASVAGDYTVVVTTSGCSSAPSATTTVTINPNPNATITVASVVVQNSTGNPASVANAGVGATYAWSITNGTITGGAGTPNITFTAGPVGPMSLQVTVTTAAGCSDTKSANFTSALPTVTVTSVVPNSGTRLGGTSVTVNGTGFAAGATVTFGGTAATNVVVVSSIKITAKTPAHTPGTVNVTVTNTDTSTGTLVNGYTFVPRQFDANNDGVVDPADIFFLVNYLFLGGPAPTLAKGDANGDGVIDPADIFYIVNFLFMGGPAPYDADDPSRISAQAADNTVVAGAVTLGEPVLRAGRYVIPVSVSAAPGSSTPQALSLRVRFTGNVAAASIQRAGAARDTQPAFEISRQSRNTLSYLVAFDERTGGLALGATRSAVIAELVIDARGGRVNIDIDPALTQLTNQAGTQKATVAGGTLRVSGTSIDIGRPEMQKRNIN